MRTALTLPVAVAASLCISTVLGYKFYQDRIPNGKSVPNPSGGIWGGVGHLAPEGKGPRNPFGVDFKNNNHVWNAALCNKDSDGDGLTNGQELGDPQCQWTQDGSFTPDPATGHPGVREAPTLKVTGCTPKSGSTTTFLCAADADVTLTCHVDFIGTEFELVKDNGNGQGLIVAKGKSNTIPLKYKDSKLGKGEYLCASGSATSKMITLEDKPVSPPRKHTGRCDHNPCQNNATCIWDLDKHCLTCECKDGYNGMLCQFENNCPLVKYSKQGWSLWKSANTSKCLKKLEVRGDRQVAIDECYNVGGRMVEPRSRDQMNDLHKYTGEMRYWLGIEKRISDDTWVYSSDRNGSEAFYYNWILQSGPLGWNEKDRCVVADGERLAAGNKADADGRWADRGCVNKDCDDYQVVCEVEFEKLSNGTAVALPLGPKPDPQPL